MLYLNKIGKTVMNAGVKKEMITNEDITKAFKMISKFGLICPKDDSLIFYNLSLLEKKIIKVKELFPDNAIHTIALKANPVKNILSFISSYGFGFEAASLPEIYMAVNSKIRYDNIVFDSPVKTIEELSFAIDLGVHINADSIMELGRIDQILKNKKTNSTFGIRINPQVGYGSIKATSVAGTISKFGVPLNEMKIELMECFVKYSWLNGVHVHIGSQGCDVELMIQGISKVFDFSCDVNEKLKQLDKHNRIKLFDIGGGLTVQYHPDDTVVSMENYVNKLKQTFPKLFDGSFRLITEFGRFFHANCAWAISKVEYVKNFNMRNIAMIHLGADMFLRECYNPKDWYHNITVMDKNGDIKNDSVVYNYDIAGPLCFSGDIIAYDVSLPKIDESDYIIIHDIGAYTFSMWSRYNSRQMPKIIGYKDNNFEIVKKKENIDDVLNFWK